MRVPENIKHRTAQRDINAGTARLNRLSSQISSGKKINVVSDDPVGAILSENYKTSLKSLENVQKNLVTDQAHINAMDQATKQMVEALTIIKQKGLEGANGFISQEAAETIANEVELLSQQIVDSGNSKLGKTYIFAGTKTLTPPLVEGNEISKALADLPLNRLKSIRNFEPAELDVALQSLKAGTLTFALRNVDTSEVTEIQVELAGKESLNEVITKINRSMSAEYSHTPAISPSGYLQNLYAQIGADGHIYYNLSQNYALESMVTESSFNDVAEQFNIIGDETSGQLFPENQFERLGSEEALEDQGQFFRGFSERTHIVEIIRPGNMGEAQYVVSDDSGKTWSDPKKLELVNKIVNKNGEADSQITLEFSRPNFKRFFWEGTRFTFSGNPAIHYQGNDQIREIPTDDGKRISLGVTARQLLYKGEGEQVDILDAIHRLKENIKNQELYEISKTLRDIDLGLNQLIHQRGEIGATAQQLEKLKERLEDGSFNNTKHLSELEDLDISRATIDLNAAELQKQVVLNSTSKLIQPSLVQFLR